MSLPTRRAALAALIALVPAAAVGKKKRKTCKRPRPCCRCRGQTNAPCSHACEEDTDCAPGGLSRCHDGRCQYCPSEAWDFADEAASLCVREGWSPLLVSCEPW